VASDYVFGFCANNSGSETLTPTGGSFTTGSAASASTPNFYGLFSSSVTPGCSAPYNRNMGVVGQAFKP
jgi:hypothetical protein